MKSSGVSSTDGEAPNGSRARKAEQTRTRLLDAARKTFEEKGFLTSTVADIVNRAGVAHGTFYNHFQSREDILRAVATEADERLYAPMGEVILDRSSNLTPAQRIRRGVHALLTTYRDEVQIMRVIEEVSRYDDFIRASRLERQRRWRDEITKSIHGLQRRGLADPGLDPMLTCMILGSITTHFPEMWLVDQLVDCSLDEAVDAIAKVFVKVLGLSEPTE